MLYISEIIGGPELINAPVTTFLTRLYNDDPIDCGTSLDIVFQVPGSVFTPEFEGVRTGRLSRREKIMQVQIAVPRSVIYAPADEILAFVYSSLRKAIQLASEKLSKARVPFDVAVLTDLVKRMESRHHH